MNIKKALLVGLAIIILIIIAFTVVIKLQSKPMAENVPSPAPVEQPAAAPMTQEQAKKITDAKVQQIMNDNITGTVEKIDATSITVKAADGTTKDMTMAAGKTFVVGQTGNTMVGKQLSDVKVGMKVFVHFDKDTNLATTITLVQ